MRRLMILGLVAMVLLGACGSNNSGSSAAKGSNQAVATLTGSGGAGGYGYGAASAATAASSPSPAAAANGATVMTATAGTHGTILVDGSGNALYRFDQDTPASSACTAACANIWPPLTVTSGQPTAAMGVRGTLGTLARADGAKQVTYNGAPLYRYSKDSGPGQATGDGIGGVWHVAKP